MLLNPRVWYVTESTDSDLFFFRCGSNRFGVLWKILRDLSLQCSLQTNGSSMKQKWIETVATCPSEAHMDNPLKNSQIAIPFKT